MVQEIKAIIEKNLPAEVSTVLQERLKQADRDADEVKHLNGEIKSYQKEVQRFKALIIEYQAFDQRNAALDQREIDLKKIEHDLDLSILRGQIAAEKEKVEFTKSIALGLVRNTNYRKSIFDSENQAPYFNGNQQVYPTSVNKSLTENQTED